MDKGYIEYDIVNNTENYIQYYLDNILHYKNKHGYHIKQYDKLYTNEDIIQIIIDNDYKMEICQYRFFYSLKFELWCNPEICKI